MIPFCMNVVIDCNIFISAILSQEGFAIEVLRKALKKEIIPQFGQKLFNEYEDVLSRKDLISKSKLTKSQNISINRLLDEL